MPSPYSDRSAAYVESCMWLPASSTATHGWLIASGWAFVAGKQPYVALSTDQSLQTVLASEFFLPCYSRRDDVGAVYTEAPLHCGFYLTIPTDHSILHAPCPALIFRCGEEEWVSHLGKIIDTSDPEGFCAQHGLDAIDTIKLRNLLHSEQERLQGVVHKSSQPISLYIDPSFACNLHCPHCVSGTLRNQGFSRKVMSLSLLKEIVDQYGPFAIRVTLALWGEPLLNKRFVDIVRLLKAHKIFCETSTNLSVPLSPSTIDGLVASGLDEIRLSIDGATQETYSRYRVGGDLDLVLRNLRALVGAKRRLGAHTPKLRWQYLLFPWNTHEKDQAEQLAIACGVDEFYCYAGDMWERPHPMRGRVAADDVIPLDAQYTAKVDHSAQHAMCTVVAGCDFLEHTLAIHSDGTVFPCCYFPAPKEALGTWQALRNDPFNAPRLIQLREFVHNLRAGTITHGPSPCVTCNQLYKGNVPDHLSFSKALSILMERRHNPAIVPHPQYSQFAQWWKRLVQRWS